MSEHDQPHVPPPSLWPVGFAVGVACILVGLVVSWPAVAVGAVIAVVFAFLWIRDLTAGVRAPHAEAPAAPPPTSTEKPLEGAPAMPPGDEDHRYDRSVFLEGATLGLGGVIGGLVTLPVLGFAVLPSFTNQHKQNVELGPLDEFPEGEYVIATYLEDEEVGEVTRRTVYVRNNGQLDGKPSFTVLFSRCVHLGCPVQPNGPMLGEPKRVKQVELTRVQPSGFGCPCHGGQYDTEGNRTAGPPVRSLDRAEFSIRDGSLWLGKFYSVAKVEGQGKSARIKKYGRMPPGVHVDGVEAWLYPLEAPS